MNQSGVITVNEHTTLPCVVYVLSEVGVRLLFLDTAEVPDTFGLNAPCFGSGVCEVVWRSDEMIGARQQRFAA
ncbi:hypothetical protein GCM10007886_16290 [Methylobacterium gregans]|nr:hypothetical protein GCM10007886_16290 [Methylobacterium gregans]